MGDEILSINGVSVKNKTLLNCASMLEEAEIVVALQIRKPDPFVKGSMLGLLYTNDSNDIRGIPCQIIQPLHQHSQNPTKVG